MAREGETNACRPDVMWPDQGKACKACSGSVSSYLGTGLSFSTGLGKSSSLL